MHKIANSLLLTGFLGLAGLAMLSAGEHPLRILFIVLGFALLMLRASVILDRGRIRRGKPSELVSSFTSTVEDIGAMTRRDWQDLGLTAAAATSLVCIGLFAFGKVA